MTSTDNTQDNADYAHHLQQLQSRWNDALEVSGFDAALVAAGESRPYFLDDQAPVFRANPHLAQWFTDDQCEQSLLLVAAGKRPRLFFYQPEDYWHQPPQAPERLTPFMDLQLYNDPAKLEAAAVAAASQINRVAYIGEKLGNELPGNLPVSEVNPAQLISQLSYLRAYKTEFEVACMRTATEMAVAGHLAARQAFADGAAEFEIQLRYLAASRQTQSDVPYANIVALNEHAGVLHYQHYDREPPASRNSFLIDAGARHQCYASDITRTYCADGAGDGAGPGSETFAQLIAQLDRAQLDLIASIRTGQNYLDLHVDMHRRIGHLLADNKLVNCSAQAAFDLGITRSFLPHGLGHLLGLQTHDVGGQQRSPDGGHNPPPEEYAALRLTRPVETRQVFTIEPGLYFIPMLLRSLREGAHSGEVNWGVVDELVPFGGIRIEDNVVVTDSGTENLTREAFAAVATP